MQIQKLGLNPYTGCQLDTEKATSATPASNIVASIPLNELKAKVHIIFLKLQICKLLSETISFDS